MHRPGALCLPGGQRDHDAGRSDVLLHVVRGDQYHCGRSFQGSIPVRRALVSGRPLCNECVVKVLEVTVLKVNVYVLEVKV